MRYRRPLGLLALALLAWSCGSEPAPHRGPVVLITLAGLRFPQARGTAVGLTTGAGALGGFVVPWLHGGLGDAAGVALAVGALGVWCAVIAAAALAARRGG